MDEGHKFMLFTVLLKSRRREKLSCWNSSCFVVHNRLLKFKTCSLKIYVYKDKLHCWCVMF